MTRSLVAQPPDQRAELGDLLVVEPAGRLVEQQQLGPRCERARQFDPLAGAERQAFGQFVRDGAQLEQVEEPPRGLLERPLLAPHPRQMQGVADEVAAAARMPADPHIVEHRLALEQGEVLKGAANAEVGDAMGRPAEQRAAREPDIAADRRVKAAQAIEQGRLARPIGPDQPEDLTLIEIERHAVERDDAAEPYHDLADLEQLGPGRAISHRRGRKRRAALPDMHRTPCTPRCLPFRQVSLPANLPNHRRCVKPAKLPLLFSEVAGDVGGVQLRCAATYYVRTSG